MSGGEEIYDEGTAASPPTAAEATTNSSVKNMKHLFEQGPLMGVKSYRPSGPATTRPAVTAPKPSGPKPAISPAKPSASPSLQMTDGGKSTDKKLSVPLKPSTLAVTPNMHEQINGTNKLDHILPAASEDRSAQALSPTQEKSERVEDSYGKAFYLLKFILKPKNRKKPQSLENVDLPAIKRIGIMRGASGLTNDRVSKIASYTEEDEEKDITPVVEESYDDVVPNTNTNASLPSPPTPDRPKKPEQRIPDYVEESVAEEENYNELSAPAEQIQASTRGKSIKNFFKGVVKSNSEKEKNKKTDLEKLIEKYKLTDEEMGSNHLIRSMCDIAGGKNTLTVKATEYVFLIKKISPKQWIVRNRDSQFGIVDASKMVDVELEQQNKMPNGTDNHVDEEVYEELGNN